MSNRPLSDEPRRQPWILILALLTATALGSSCRAFRASAKSAPNADEEKTERESNIVVLRLSKKSTVIDSFGKDYWIKAREAKGTTLARVQAQIATGQMADAERTARAFLAKKPGNTAGLAALTHALVARAKWDAAIYYSKMLAKRKPGSPEALNIQGLAILMRAKTVQDYKRAARFFQGAHSGSKKDIAAGLNLAYLYLELGDFKNSAKVFEVVRNRCDDCTPALLGHGIALHKTGKNKVGIEAIEAILEEEEDNGAALFYSAMVYHTGLGETQIAKERLDKLLATPKAAAHFKNRARELVTKIRAAPASKKTPTG